MQKLKQYWVIISLAVILLGVAFYWYSYRPSKIREMCASEATRNNGWSNSTGDFYASLKTDWDYLYQRCVRGHGL